MTMKQLHWEDIEVGGELPPLVKKPNTKTIVMWAGAADAYGEIHYDKDIAVKSGFKGVILHGDMMGAYLMQVFTDRIGSEGYISSISFRLLKPTYPNQDLHCRAKAVQKYVKEAKAYVEFDTWIETASGEKTCEGKTTVCLPKTKQ